MPHTAIDIVPLWLFLPLAAFLGMASVEAGYRFGLWRHLHVKQEKESTVSAIVGSILGLLGIMMAFTFNMAATRFDARRQGVLMESNAIGTTFLRTRFLPEPQRTESADLLKEYTQIRLPNVMKPNLASMLKNSEAIHVQLWNHATAAAEKTPTSIMIGLYIQSLNELIDDHSSRILIGLRSRLPGSIWITLFGLAVLGHALLGYQSGLAATRRSPAVFVMTFAFAVVLFLIVDLDRPNEGLLQVSQQSMIDLYENMKAGK